MEAKITPLRLLIFAELVAGFLAWFGYWPAHVPRDGYFDCRRIARAWFACASLFCAGAGLACFVEREFGMFPPTSPRPFIIAGGVVLMLVAVVWMHSLRAGFLPTLSTGVVHPVIGIDSPGGSYGNRRQDEMMADTDSRVTIHMAASLDGFIARKDGRVDWLEISDEFAGGDTLDPGFVEAFLKTIDCYVMGSRTYETALNFEAKGVGWAYGDKPTFVLTSRALPRTRDTVEFYSGDLAQFVNGHLRLKFRSIWFVGGGKVSAECLRLGLADEVRYSILPILIGDGIPFFEKLDRDIDLHLAEVNAYKNGTVELRYEVRGDPGEPRNAT